MVYNFLICLLYYIEDNSPKNIAKNVKFFLHFFISLPHSHSLKQKCR